MPQMKLAEIYHRVPVPCRSGQSGTTASTSPAVEIISVRMWGFYSHPADPELVCSTSKRRTGMGPNSLAYEIWWRGGPFPSSVGLLDSGRSRRAALSFRTRA